MDKAKLELLITARNSAKKELDAINKQLADIEGASKGLNTKALAESLGQLAGGPMASIIMSLKSMLTLGGMIPKVFLGPIALVIAAVGILGKKFGIVSKSIETVMQVFESLISLDFAGMGEKISEIWKKPTKASQEAINKAKEYQDTMFDTQEKIMALTGKRYDAERQQATRVFLESTRLITAKGEKATAEEKAFYELQKQLWIATDADITAREQKELAEKLQATKDLYAKEQDERIKNAQMRMETDKIFADARKEVEKAEYDRKTEEIQAYNDALERINKRRLAREDREAQRNQIAIQRYYSEVASFISPLFDSLTDTLGGMFDRMVNEGASAMDVLKDAFTSFGRMALQMIGKLIAKFLVLSALKSLFSGSTGGIGAAISAYATNGLNNLFHQYQTPQDMMRTIPGAPGMPVPIIAHGQEVIGRPSSGSFGGGVVYNVHGDVYGWDGAVERIRTGLINHQRRTGAGLSFA